MSRALRFWAAILPSFLAVAALAVQAELRLRHGVEVLLEVRPFDPMDALSGRYLAVPLAVERLDLDELLAERETFGTGDTLWLRLDPGEPWWRPGAVLEAPPEEGEVALRGTVTRVHGRALQIDYGLGRFFIPHEGADPTLPGTGPAAGAPPSLVAVVRVTRDGRAALADLLVDGEPYARWNARQAPTRR